jgi:hypothetical protein
MTAALLLALAVAQGLFSGVRSRVERTGRDRPPRAKNCAVQFFQENAPNRPHEALAVIQRVGEA